MSFPNVQSSSPSSSTTPSSDSSNRKEILAKLKNYTTINKTSPINISEMDNMVNKIDRITREGEYNSYNQKVIGQLISFLSTEKHRFFDNFKPEQNIEAEVNKHNGTLTGLLRVAKHPGRYPYFESSLTQSSIVSTHQADLSSQETDPHQKIITHISGADGAKMRDGFSELIKLIQEGLTHNTDLTSPISDLLSKVLATRNGKSFFAIAMNRNITDITSKDRVIEILEKQGFKWDNIGESGFVGMNRIQEYDCDFTTFH